MESMENGGGIFVLVGNEGITSRMPGEDLFGDLDPSALHLDEEVFVCFWLPNHHLSEVTQVWAL